MRIAVCVKQVVTREWQVRVNEAGTWVRDGDASFELNEPDAYALEEALRLREKHSGEVVVVSAGPARATQVLRESLARGVAEWCLPLPSFSHHRARGARRIQRRSDGAVRRRRRRDHHCKTR